MEYHCLAAPGDNHVGSEIAGDIIVARTQHHLNGSAGIPACIFATFTPAAGWTTATGILLAVSNPASR